MAPFATTASKLAVAKSIERKSSSSRIGCSTRRLKTTNAVTDSTAATAEPTTSGSTQPRVAVRFSASTAAPSEIETNNVPTRSTSLDVPTVVVLLVIVRSRRRSPSGTRNQKTARQPIHSTSGPPTMGPIARPAAAAVWNTPTARVWAVAEPVVSSAGADAITMATPMPCNTRAANNSANVGAVAHSTNATLEMPAPVLSTRAYPQVSASCPAANNNPP